MIWLRLLLAWACLLGSADLAQSAGSESTHNTLPQAGASFLPQLQAFLKQEDAKRFAEQFSGIVTSGGTHSTVMALTATPSDMVAYPGGYYTTQVGGSVTYNASDTCWVIAHKDLTGNQSTFTRSSGTHYLVDCASGAKPTLPANSVWLMQVTTNGSAVTAVIDLRSRTPTMPVYLQSELPAAGTWGRTAFVTDYNSGTIFWDTGSAWATVTGNPMTAASDLIVGGTNGVPTRFVKGAANQVLGMNNADTVQEWKTITAGAGISVSHSANAVTVTQTVFPPAGSLTLYAGTSPPSGWLLCDGASTTANTVPNLAAVLIPNASTWGRGLAIGSFACDVGTDVCTLNNHGLIDTQIVHVATTGVLPTGLTANTVLYIRDQTLNTFKLALTSGGTAIDIQSTGSGVQSIYDQIVTPDMRGRTPIGIGAGTGLTNRTLGSLGGFEDAIVVTHNHTVTDPGHTHSTSSNRTGGTTSPVADNYWRGTGSEASGSAATGLTVNTTGSSGAGANMPPFLVMNYIIKS